MIGVLIFNFLLISFLSFFTTYFLVEGIIFCCRIRSLKGKIYLLMLPFIKLFYDCIFWNKAKHVALGGFFPHMGIENSRILNMFIQGPFPRVGLYFEYINGMGFTIADFLYGIFSTKIVLSLSIVLIISYFSLLFYKIGGVIREYLFIRKVLQEVEIIHFFLGKQKVKLLKAKNYLESPFVFGLFKKQVVIPSNFLFRYSKEEQEAIIAHEITHIENKDLLINLTMIISDIIFAHIPMKVIIRRVSFLQECLCDQKAMDHGIRKKTLSIAMLKSVNFKMHLVSAFSGRTSLVDRIHFLKNYKKRKEGKSSFLFFAIALYLALGVFLAKLWTI